MTSVTATEVGVDLAALFRRARGVFEAAVLNAEHRERTYCIAGQTIRLIFAAPRLDALLSPALAHLETDASGRADLTVRLWDSASTSTTMPPPPWSAPRYIRLGRVFDEHDGRYCSSFRLWTNALSMLDLQTGEGLFWTRNAAELDSSDSAAPLRDLFHWWMTAGGFTFLHAAVVGTKDKGALIAGPGGSGKSTSSLACLSAGMGFLGDDFCVMEDGKEAFAHSLYSSARMELNGVNRLPYVRRLLHNGERLSHEKGLLFLKDSFGGQLVKRMRLAAVVIPHIAEGTVTRAEPMSGVHALRALAPSSLFQFAGTSGSQRIDRRDSFERMARLVRQIPSYRLTLGGDPTDVPPVIEQILAGDLGNQHPT